MAQSQDGSETSCAPQICAVGEELVAVAMRAEAALLDLHDAQLAQLLLNCGR
jgi:hypothetical protein